jgi:hypothetical protein
MALGKELFPKQKKKQISRTTGPQAGRRAPADATTTTGISVFA